MDLELDTQRCLFYKQRISDIPDIQIHHDQICQQLHTDEKEQD